MSIECTHIIQKQVLNINIDSPAYVPEIGPELYSKYMEIISDQLDNLYSRFFKEHQYVIIDHLELNIEVQDPTNLSEELPPKLTESLFHALEDLTNSSPIIGGERAFTSKSVPFEILRSYIHTGRLPHWVQKVPDWKMIKPEFLHSETKRIKELVLVTMNHSKYKQVIRRILSVFEDKELMNILELNAEIGIRHTINTLLIHVPGQSQKNASSREIVWFATFRVLIKSGSITPTKLLGAYIDDVCTVNRDLHAYDILSQFEEKLKSGNSQEQKALLATTAYQEFCERIHKNQNTVDQSSLDTKLEESANMDSLVPAGNIKYPDKQIDTMEFGSLDQESVGDIVEQELSNAATDSKMTVNDGEHSRESSPSNSDQNAQKLSLENNERLLVGNAGLVLLWPFLEGYFESVGLTTHSGFKSELSANKATSHLYYLATGEVEPVFEYDLIVPQLLCGIVGEVEPFQDFTLSASEQQFGDGLVQALIENWPAVKDTSIQSVRETFFKRDGKLSSNNGSWLLELRKEAWDVLLDRLPWGIGLIHLPWMKEMIHVAWENET